MGMDGSRASERAGGQGAGGELREARKEKLLGSEVPEGFWEKAPQEL